MEEKEKEKGREERKKEEKEKEKGREERKKEEKEGKRKGKEQKGEKGEGKGVDRQIITVCEKGVDFKFQHCRACRILSPFHKLTQGCRNDKNIGGNISISSYAT